MDDQAEIKEEAQYMIWSFEHNAWWMANHRGYTGSRSNAGQYTYKEALEICLGANRSFYMGRSAMPYEVMVPILVTNIAL